MSEDCNLKIMIRKR